MPLQDSGLDLIWISVLLVGALQCVDFIEKTAKAPYVRVGVVAFGNHDFTARGKDRKGG